MIEIRGEEECKAEIAEHKTQCAAFLSFKHRKR